MAVRLEAVKLCHIHAARAAELTINGWSISSIAAELGISWQKAKEAVAYSRTLGDSWGLTPPVSVIPKPKKPPKPPRRIDEVLRLRDQESLTVAQIVSKLGISQRTVMRCYSWDRKEKSLDSLKKPRKSTHDRSVIPPRATL